MSTTTVLALFRDQRDAEAAIRALKSAHFENARLGLTAPGDAHVPRFGVAAVAGVGAGTVACALVGMALGVILTVWMHVGPFVIFMLGITGAATGALAGMLISQSFTRTRCITTKRSRPAARWSPLCPRATRSRRRAASSFRRAHSRQPRPTRPR